MKVCEPVYNIYDPQLGEYYREGITLGEAKEYAICFMEQSMLEQGEIDIEERRANIKLLNEIMNDETEADVAESLEIFDYSLEKQGE